jgi:hypothetical protein
VHGELGDRAKLEAWLREDCPARAPTAWIDDALARPRVALAGVGLVLAGPGPAGMAMLDRYPWLPLGLVPVVATPAELQHAPAPELDAPLPEIEWIEKQ